LIISATGEVLKPIVLHGGPQKYVPCEDLLPQFHLYQTKKGYMDKEAFKDIMLTYFIPHIKKMREEINNECELLQDRIDNGCKSRVVKNRLEQLSKRNQHAVLVLDGHKSRYDPETLWVLREADIDLVIIPAHSSHIIQPLDLRLNGLIKHYFCLEYQNKIPAVLEETLHSKPSKEKTVESEDSHDENNDDNEGTGEAGMKIAPYKRLHLLSAIRNAVRLALTPDNILSAWKASHLYPFTGEPPYSKEKEQEKLKEIKASSYLVKLNVIENTDGKKTGVVNKSITGVVNSPNNITEMCELLAQEIVPEACTGQCNILFSDGPLTALVEAPVDNDDVGDYVEIVPGAKTSGPLSGKCDACCYVQLDSNDF